jgi:cytochrome c oxidase assembly protein subunit 15
MSSSRYNPALHWFALATTGCTLFLIALGGLVTSKGVGMAVPDWPNTYGYNMFFFPISQWVGGIFYEHTHRLVASGVGLLTSVLALWLHGTNARKLMRWLGVILLILAALTVVMTRARWADAVVVGIAGAGLVMGSLFWPTREPAPRWLRRLGVVAFFAVVAQGVLGGLRVTAIKDEIGIFHGMLAQAFFVLLCGISLFTSRTWLERAPTQSLLGNTPAGKTRPYWIVMIATGLIFLQLVLGATMRHQHAGLAIPDFPAAYGRLWPRTDAASVERYNQQRLEIVAVKPITAFQVQLQMAHRITAVLILGAVALCAIRTWRRLGLKDLQSKLCLLWAGLICAQVGLGAWTIWSNKAADIATAHVVIGVLALATGVIVCILLVHSSRAARFIGSPGSLGGRNQHGRGSVRSAAATSD